MQLIIQYKHLTNSHKKASKLANNCNGGVCNNKLSIFILIKSAKILFLPVTT